MNNNTLQQNTTIVQGASQAAIKAGILCSISFLCCVRGISSPTMATVGHFTALWAAYDIFKSILRYRLNISDIKFGKCLKMAFLTCIFAGLLTNVVQYLYFQFFDKGFFLSSLASVMESPEYKEMINSVFADVPQSEWDNAFEQINLQTLMAQMVFVNLLLSVPVSLITAGLATIPTIKGRTIERPGQNLDNN